MGPEVVSFIAETDGDGNIVALWRAGRGVRSPRPVGTGREELDEVSVLLDDAKLSGASLDSIRDWVKSLRSGTVR